ncbi:MAG: gliding motility-associated C-terminal domain-containing protein [Candidatus Peribacteria bacterium]|nr:MAG: gliding motility-associated C-terminal domain-containing protein [Candidatus Peribacteria bacterium]
MVLHEPNCFGENNGSITVYPNAVQPYFVNWNTGKLGNTNSQIYSGSYQVTLTDKDGCSVTETIFLDQPSLLSLDTLLTPPLCFGGKDGKISVVASGAVAPYDYFWASGETDSTLTNIKSGVHELSVSDSHGCEESLQIYLPQPDSMQLVVHSQPATCKGIADGSAKVQVFGGTPDYDLAWDTGADSNEATQLLAGLHTLTVTDQHECIAHGQVIVDAEHEDNAYIPNAFSPNGDGINDVFTVYSGQCVEEVVVFKVFDRWGGLVFAAHHLTPNDLAQGWQGVVKEVNAQNAVFAWFAEITYFSGKTELQKGSVTLIR